MGANVPIFANERARDVRNALNAENVRVYYMSVRMYECDSDFPPSSAWAWAWLCRVLCVAAAAAAATTENMGKLVYTRRQTYTPRRPSITHSRAELHKIHSPTHRFIYISQWARVLWCAVGVNAPCCARSSSICLRYYIFYIARVTFGGSGFGVVCMYGRFLGGPSANDKHHYEYALFFTRK